MRDFTCEENERMDKADRDAVKWLPVIFLFIAVVAFLSNKIHMLEQENELLKNPTIETKINNLHTYMRADETKIAWRKSYCKK